MGCVLDDRPGGGSPRQTALGLGGDERGHSLPLFVTIFDSTSLPSNLLIHLESIRIPHLL